jgi:hypothetical protein
MSLRSSSAICEARSVTASRAKVVAAMKEILEPTASWAASGAGRGQGQPSGVQRGERDLQAGALGADAVGGGDSDLVEAGDAVLDAAQAHEGVAVLDRDAGRVGLDDEGGDAALVALGLRYPCHDDEEVGDHAVGRPQLDPVEDVVVPVRYRGGGQARRVGADIGLGQQEGADVGAGAARQELLLLLGGAEQLERLRYADRLMGGEQDADRGAGRTGQGEGLVVVDLGEAKTAVLGVDLHAEGAEFLEPVDHVVGDPGLAFDQGAVDLRLDEVTQLGEELLATLGGLVRGHRVGVDEVEAEAAEEQFLGEAGLAPLLLPGRLRHLACLTLSDSRLRGCCGHEAHLAANRDLGPFGYRRVLPDRMYPITDDPTTPRAAVQPMLTEYDFVSRRPVPLKTSVPDSMPETYLSLLSRLRRTSAWVKSSRLSVALVVLARRTKEWTFQPMSPS